PSGIDDSFRLERGRTAVEGLGGVVRPWSPMLTSTRLAPRRRSMPAASSGSSVLSGHAQDYGDDDEQDDSAHVGPIGLVRAAPIRLCPLDSPSWPGCPADSVVLVSTSTPNSSPIVGSRPIGPG